MIERVDSEAPDRRVESPLVELLRAERQGMAETLQPRGTTRRMSFKHALITNGRRIPREVERMFTNSDRPPMNSGASESVSTVSTDDSDSDSVLVTDPPYQWFIPNEDDGFGRFLSGKETPEEEEERKKKDQEALEQAVNGKRITGPKDLGISKKQIRQLRQYYEKGKVKKIAIKEGIPFVPSFLISFIVTLILLHYLPLSKGNFFLLWM